MTIALSLIALALGYKVFVDASHNTNAYRVLGRAIGIYVMILAFAVSAYSLMKFSCRAAGLSCPVAKMCPIKK
jgi:hypothetical protein